MKTERIAEIALSFGYRPRLRKDGRMDLSSSLFNFAQAIVAEQNKEILQVLIASADALEVSPTSELNERALSMISEYVK